MNDRRRLEKQVWQAVQAAANAFLPHYGHLNVEFLQEEGMEGADWFAALAAHGVAPEPLTADFFCEISPFTVRARRIEALEGAVQRGFLVKAGEARYQLTEKGRRGLLRFYEDTQRFIGEMTPIPDEEVEAIAMALGQIVAATRDVSLPIQKRFLTILERIAPRSDAAAIVRAEQFLTDLGLYRDDAHSGAWESLGVSGQAWEALTLVWRGDAQTAADLHARLGFRGVEAGSWTAVLQACVAKGWLAEGNGRYFITPDGFAVREKAEAQTDTYFFAGWSVLDDDTLVQLAAQLSKLTGALNRQTASAIWQAGQALTQNVQPLYRPQLLEQVQAAQFQAQDLFIGQFSFLKAPTLFSVIDWHRLSPYRSIDSMRATLDEIVERGVLSKVGADDYQLSEQGRENIKAFYAVLDERLNSAPLLDAPSQKRLLGLLQKVVQNANELGEPQDKFHLQLSSKANQRGVDGMVAIVQLLSNLAWFRDDAHQAAWQPTGMDGTGWEVFTFIWRKEAQTVADLEEKRAFRGDEATGVSQAVARLLALGWISEENGRYAVTENGRFLRESAESKTDELFYAPFEQLASPEQTQLLSLLREAVAKAEALTLEKAEAS